ncbi:hypothetical protein ASH00_12880 [Arthrobacter sp. Soil782]|uniref:hybrid sensor histidine kinase/response regulator transcription factor n=1 Tax=Arthrobacter sp. Soil782 TaxID=1736410 RepID=UPI00070027EC|nr:LuxR C-terminal-related transcriptional regulator [Arthrobacter sp. Soil782]KRF05277.1 hypothetical protein ASH00_12880 [Arthrobacter sp. Soil782]
MDAVAQSSVSLPSGVRRMTGFPEELDPMIGIARDLAGRFEIQALLQRILIHATSLLHCESGSIALVDEAKGTYTKKVDIGVGCQEGQTFSLAEGLTGRVVGSRSTVVLDAYSEIERGHIAANDPRWNCAVIGVPLQWDERIVGAFILFSPDSSRTFTRDEARLAELFAGHAAIALGNYDLHAQAAAREREAAVAAERERAVRDVHETLGRSLAALLLSLDDADKALAGVSEGAGPDTRKASAHISTAKTVAHDALAETRRTALGLGPASLAGKSLAEAIRGELVWAEAMSGAATRLTIIGDQLPLAPEVEHQAFKIVQEALNNVVLHSRAVNVRVGLIHDGGSLAVVIEDNGRGFDPATAHGDHSTLPTSCLGLHGMTSRAIHLGGTLQIDSVPGWGTTVKAVLPHAAPDRRAVQEPRWRILIAHDAPVVSAGLVRLLGIAEPAIQVGAEVHSADQLLEAYELLHPDVVLMDLDMVHAHTALVGRMRELGPDAVVVVLTDNPTVDQVRSAKQVGVRGFINRRAGGESIARTIVAAGQGQALLEGDVFDRLLDSSEEKETDNLTTREREVCAMVIRGMADKQIARELQISVKTVEKHVGSILRKTGARNRTMLVGMSGRTADSLLQFDG